MKAACKVIWNGVHNALHVTVTDSDPEPASPVTERHATVNLGQIHQVAVVTHTGEVLVISGQAGIRSLKRLHSKQLDEVQKGYVSLLGDWERNHQLKLRWPIFFLWPQERTLHSGPGPQLSPGSL